MTTNIDIVRVGESAFADKGIYDKGTSCLIATAMVQADVDFQCVGPSQIFFNDHICYMTYGLAERIHNAYDETPFRPFHIRIDHDKRHVDLIE